MESQKRPNCKSIVFEWKSKDFDTLLKSCDVDDEVEITLKHLLDKNAKILEAGCGLGRVVKYLHDREYKQVSGIELHAESVTWLNQHFPELDIYQGDILDYPYEANSYDVVLSYGVVEHFPEGVQAPMKAMYDLLKPGGIAIVTVPSFNILRRLRYFLHWLDPRKYRVIRKIFGKKQLKWNGKRFGYYIDPQIGDFFEYRFTPKQFKSVCKKAGFEILESRPIAHVDGLFHCIGKPLVSFKDWKFTLSKTGSICNQLFSLIPYFHNHMQACVLRKPQAGSK